MAELRVTNTGTIKLFESDDTSSVTIASPASLGGDRTITLPDADVDLTEVNTMPIANLDIDGGTDIGANIADSDLLIIDDGAGGTNRKTAASRIKTYVGAGAGAFDIANLDIDGGTDIGADIADSDLFIIDDGAGGTNRKVAASRIKTYAGGGSFDYLGGINASNHNATKLQLTQVFADDYRRYKVLGKFQGTGNGADVEFRWLNSSNSELTSNYYTITDGQKSDSSSASNEEWIDWGATKTRMFRDTATGSHIHSFTMELFPNQNENVNYPTAIFQTQTWDYNSGSNRQRIIQGANYVEVTTSIAGGGIQFESTSGSFGTVNLSIWGYKDS